LRTAEEFFEYCEDNKYGKNLINDFNFLSCEIAEGILLPEEEGLIAFFGEIEPVTVLSRPEQFFLLTNKRLLITCYGAGQNSAQFLNIESLTDISYKINMMSGTIAMKTSGKTLRISVNRRSIEELYLKIEDTLFEIKSATTNNAIYMENESSSKMEVLRDTDDLNQKLEELKGLLKAGMLSKDEYESRKKELMN